MLKHCAKNKRYDGRPWWSEKTAQHYANELSKITRYYITILKDKPDDDLSWFITNRFDPRVK